MKGCNNCAKRRDIKKECPWGGSYQHCGEHGEQIGICNAYRQETNADRIRAMSDEELAGYILSDLPIYRTYKRMLEWLQEPAPEEGE